METAIRLSPRVRVGTSLGQIGLAHFFCRRFDQGLPKLSLRARRTQAIRKLFDISWGGWPMRETWSSNYSRSRKSWCRTIKLSLMTKVPGTTGMRLRPGVVLTSCRHAHRARTNRLASWVGPLPAATRQAVAACDEHGFRANKGGRIQGTPATDCWQPVTVPERGSPNLAAPLRAAGCRRCSG